MAYWGSKPDDCDFAFDAVGVYILIIKERMMKGIESVLEKRYREQGMVASLVCLRILGERFPKCLSVHFGRQDLMFVVNAFNEWIAKVGPSLPRKYRENIISEARAEFALFEHLIFNSNNDQKEEA